MVESVTNKDFFVILNCDLNALECHFFVCDPWTTELHEMNEKCFQMLKSLFSHDCMVFQSRRYHPPLPVREIAPLGCGVMASLWVQTTGFGVCL